MLDLEQEETKILQSVWLCDEKKRKERCIMRKFVLVVATLFMTMPVMAVSNVDITCSSYGNEVTVSYDSDVNRIRAFGLDITVDTGNITDVCVVDANYRIFPGQIVITSGNVTAYGTCYDPCDIGDANVTVEMGTLYTLDSNYSGDPNAGYRTTPPSKSGTLLKFHVDADCNYTIAENTLRGGVVMEDPTEDGNVTLCSGDVVVSSTISGTVSGATQAGVTMSGLPTNPVTDVNGNYSDSVPGGWSGTVTPGKTGYTFAPVNRGYVNVTTDQTAQNYVATAIPLTISGKVTCNGAGQSGVTMSGLPASPIVTDVNGDYSDTTAYYGWSGTVTPSEPNYTFTPTNRVYTSITGNQTGQNYTADCLYVNRTFTTHAANLVVNAAMMTKWVYLGKPACWCCGSQKRGNGIYTGSSAGRTDTLDLGGVKNAAAWTKWYTQAGYNPCLDFNLSGRIDTTDLGIVKNAANWTKSFGTCPTTGLRDTCP